MTGCKVFLNARLDSAKKITLNARVKRTISQFMTSSGSIAANYAEATEAMSKKDFVKSIKIARKEAKESLV